MSSKKLDITASMATTVEAPHVSKSQKDIAKEKLHQFMKEESKLVRGKFQNFESPGASASIHVKKYPGPEKGGIPEFKRKMQDGEVYDVPLYVARFLNGIDVTAGAVADEEFRNPNIGTCSYAVHGFKMSSTLQPSTEGFGPGGESGIPVPIVGISKRVQRYGFQSMEFAGAM